MKRDKKPTQVFLSLTLLLALAALYGKWQLDLSGRARHTPPSDLKPLEASYHGNSLKKYNPGFNELISGILWVQLLQQASHKPVEKDSVSWEFAQLDAITTLDPEFQHPYTFGHAFLSVFRRDNLGAKLLLEKWVKRRPHHWKALYLYSYHLFYELGDYQTAAPLMLRASLQEGAPFWLASLGVRLLEKNLATEQALAQSVELYPMLNHTHGKHRLQERIRSLRFQLLSTRWNSLLTDFKKSFGRSPATMQELAAYGSTSNRAPTALSPAQSVHEDLLPVLRETFDFRYDRATDSVRLSSQALQNQLEKSSVYTPAAH